MKILSIRTQLLAFAALCLALVAGLSVLVVLGSRGDSAALRDMYEHRFQPILALQEVDRQLKEVRFRVAGVLLEQIPVPGSRAHLKEVRASAPQQWQGFMARSGAAQGERQELVAQIDAGWEKFGKFADGLERAYAENDRKRLTELLEESWPEVHLALVKPLEKLLPLAVHEAETLYLDRASAAARRQAGAIAGLAIGTVLLAGFLFWFTRRIRSLFRRLQSAVESLEKGDLTVRLDCRICTEAVSIGAAFNRSLERVRALMSSIKQTSDSVGTASREIAQGNVDLSTRTEEQASALEQSSASMQQMTATVGQNARNAKKVNELAAQASGVAAKGGEVVREAVGTMNGITESSKKIADIIGVIDGIAFQTNILALNAAVEAARAGEQGRGFAVVASEVRSLAQRSAAAAKEIKELITDSVGKVDAGSRQVNDAGRTMEEIVASVKKVTTLIAEITAASQEQSLGIEQVSETMTQLEKVTQQNAAMVEQASAAADSLEEQSRSLASAVSAFRIAQES